MAFAVAAVHEQRPGLYVAGRRIGTVNRPRAPVR
jgi:hypothetical protein